MHAMDRPFVSILTDFGDRDPSAAICAGVVASICPDARVLELTRTIRPFAIRDGAVALAAAVPYLPVGIHIAVVDPGVGTERLPVAVRVARGDTLIGPDNGLLLIAADRLGGPVEARAITDPAWHLPAVTSSFHGRDIFAPVAAHLACGVPFEAFGPELAVADLVRLPIPTPEVRPDELATAVVYIDGFGNIKLAGGPAELRAALGDIPDGTVLAVGFAGADGAPRAEAVPWQDTFGRVPVGALLLYEDSLGRLCLAENQGSAGRRLAMTDDLPVSIRRA
jgi:S-adenosylmethionine hydrolase